MTKFNTNLFKILPTEGLEPATSAFKLHSTAIHCAKKTPETTSQKN